MDRSQLKMEANQMLSQHFGFFFTLFIPYFILNWMSSYTSSRSIIIDTNSNYPFHYDFGALSSSNIFSFIAMLFVLSAFFNLLDVWRNQSDFTNGFIKSFNILNSQRVFWGSIGISIVTFILVFLWSFLLFIPGIIKSFSYSQAIYIYRDAAKNGNPIGIMEAITKSRQLMDGYKVDYFVLKLSFIGWWLIVVISLGLAAIYVTPYYYLTMSNYYIKLLSK
ncbi:DUF975 family protein [Apilactobacillus micheneri]|uniref:DUF975 family protein n=1 Tax=Apilactobacillus micheneri TaxID=1899430 RepID=UPI000D5177D2|nr:DUF975 family protein [Apilactobacillus micheneri]GAY80443.1 hypothetical protein NBRC113063_01322 [Apilactobacillus micheneri]